MNVYIIVVYLFCYVGKNIVYYHFDMLNVFHVSKRNKAK